MNRKSFRTSLTHSHCKVRSCVCIYIYIYVLNVFRAKAREEKNILRAFISFLMSTIISIFHGDDEI